MVGEGVSSAHILVLHGAVKQHRVSGSGAGETFGINHTRYKVGKGPVVVLIVFVVFVVEVEAGQPLGFKWFPPRLPSFPLVCPEL